MKNARVIKRVYRHSISSVELQAQVDVLSGMCTTLLGLKRDGNFSPDDVTEFDRAYDALLKIGNQLTWEAVHRKEQERVIENENRQATELLAKKCIGMDFTNRIALTVFQFPSFLESGTPLTAQQAIDCLNRNQEDAIYEMANVARMLSHVDECSIEQAVGDLWDQFESSRADIDSKWYGKILSYSAICHCN